MGLIGDEAAGLPVPNGYKRTSVGVIPCDWNVVFAKDLVTHPICYGVVQVGQDSDDGVPIIAIKHLKNIDGADLHRAPVEVEKPYARTRVRAGDVLVSVKGTIGRVGIVPNGFEGNISRELARIRVRPDVSLTYVAHQLEGSGSQERIGRATVGTTRLEFSIAAVREFEIPIPSTASEQCVIAEALSDADGLLSSLDALIAKKRAIKQAAMQQLLSGKTRLPGFAGEWVTKSLGDVADILGGATPSTSVSSYWDGSIPWCTPTDITSSPGKYLTTTSRKVTAEGLKSCSATLLPPGALLLCTRATIGELKIAGVEVCTNQGFKALVCRPGTSNEFLYYLLHTLKPQMLDRAIGSTFLEIGKCDVASIVATFPREEEQVAIASVLSVMDGELTALESRRDKTRQIKQGMMQQLLTGRIRLVKPEVSVAA